MESLLHPSTRLRVRAVLLAPLREKMLVQRKAQIEAIIFDADGVLQRPVRPWRAAFAELFGLESGELDSLLKELDAAETDHLVNLNDF